MKHFTLIGFLALLISFSSPAQPVTVNWEIVENPLTVGDLPFTASGKQIWGDYNNDGQIDFFQISGQGTPFSGLYKNNGDGTFTEILTDVAMLSLASAAFFDFDNDGNLDLIVAGSLDGTPTAAITDLYRNSGAPNFEFQLVEDAFFVGISAEGGDNNTHLIEVVDYNNDGWLDVFLSGNAGGTWEVSGNSRVVALYKNNMGTFEEQTTPVDGTRNFRSMNGGGIHCGDITNNGFADMIVSGYVDGDVQSVTDLYINNGDGTFSYFENSPTLFTGHVQGETFFVDINNDGRMDIVEIGRDVNNGWASFANIFINEGDLNFTKIENSQSNLIGGGAAVATGDINNNGKVDIVASGWGPNTTFFYNNGDNSFLTAPIQPDRARARAGSVNFVDFTGDGKLDFTIFGYRDGGSGTAEDPTWPNFLLKNMGADGVQANNPPSAPANVSAQNADGNVILSWNMATDDTTPAEALRYNVFAKNKTNGKIFTYFPANIETGMLTANGVRPFISGTSITLRGMSTDDYDFGVQAVDNGNLGGPFAAPSEEPEGPTIVNWEIVENPLTAGDLPFTASGKQIWGDYNNDGQIDFFQISGQGTPFSGLYKNNGDGSFTEILTDVAMLSLASAAFFDFDNDGNLDLIVAGSLDGTSTAAITDLYRNSGAPNYEFQLVEDALFVGISAEGGDNNPHLIEIVDYNNDGWLDVFLSGNAGGTWEVSGNGRVVALYKNNMGSFELQTTPVDGNRNFRSMNGGGIHCGDITNNGYADMIVSGYVDGEVQTVTDLYINNGDGTFSYYENSPTLFTGHMQGETFFADINNDGWMDIVEIGRDVNNGWASFANIFINDGDLGFTKIESSQSNLIGGGATVATGDLNNNGWVDIVASGWGPNTTFFYNNGDNSFVRAPIQPDRARARAGNVNFVDFNSDGFLDFTIFGYRDGGSGTSEDPTWPNFLLKNMGAEDVQANTPPSAPANVNAQNDAGNVVLTWNKATDDTTPAEALRYNVFAKQKSNGKVYTYFPANIETGMLTANGVRPLISGTTITLHGMSTDEYDFGVQAVDNGNLAGPFALYTTTGIKEKPVLNVQVYAFENRIHIQNRHGESIGYQIVSLTGQVVSRGFCAEGTMQTVPVSQRGMYIIQLSGTKATTSSKVMVF